MVVVYTAENCQPCRAVKRWLESNNIEYEERNAKEHIDYLAQLGYRQAPVTTAGSNHVYGFDIKGLQRILAA